MLVVETLLLLEPSDENSFFLHELWEAQARTGKLGKYKFSSQNFLLNSLYYANEKFCKYLQLPTNYNKKVAAHFLQRLTTTMLDWKGTQLFMNPEA